MPFPCMDRDEPPTVANKTTEDEIDIDFVLLGADFPDDVDDGPVDDDPEQSHSSFGDYYLPAKRCNTETASQADFALRPSFPRDSATLPSSSSVHLLSEANASGYSFGGTYIVASVQEWREVILVFLI